MNSFSDKVSFIWSVADLLRGPYRPNQYGRVILPLTVLRRLDCVLEPTKDKVLKKAESLAGGKVGNVDPILNRAAGVPFHNTSKLTFARLTPAAVRARSAAGSSTTTGWTPSSPCRTSCSTTPASSPTSGS